jgi:hypothetical protein
MAGSSASHWATYTPNAGFRLADTEHGTVNFMLYTYVRYLNQKGLEDTYTDAFGRTSDIDKRHDILFQKVNLQFAGWLLDPRFTYLAYVWTSNTSQGLGAQVVVGGKLNFRVGPHLTVGGGIDALPGVRALEGNFPMWLTVDNRAIAAEFFRPSYTMGVWARGEVVEGLSYRAMLGNNLSQLGVDAGQLDDKLATWAFALVWYPTTGEYGTREGFGDFDHHETFATRLGAHYTRSVESRQGQPRTDAFENVQIRLSDGNTIFQPDLFDDDLQIDEATYQMIAVDAGFKYRGFSLWGEFYLRKVNDFVTIGSGDLPFETLDDNGFQVQASAMAIRKTLQVYAAGSWINGEYGDPTGKRVGVNWFPYRNHVLRWNLEYLHTDRCPVGAQSLPYTVGGTGGIVHSSLQLNF